MNLKLNLFLCFLVGCSSVPEKVDVTSTEYTVSLEGQMEEGIKLEKESRWTEALSFYQSRLSGSESQKAYALFRMSFVYESKNESDLALATLEDAERLESFLPSEIARVEIPFRKYQIYHQMQMQTLSESYLEKTYQGLKIFKDQKIYLKLLLEMGQMPEPDVNNYFSWLDRFQKIQGFLLECVEYKNTTESTRAREKLLSYYSKLDQLTEMLNLQQTLFFTEYEVQKLRSTMRARLLESMDQLKAFSLTEGVDYGDLFFQLDKLYLKNQNYLLMEPVL